MLACVGSLARLAGRRALCTGTAKLGSLIDISQKSKFGIAELKVPRPCAPGSLISMIICQVMKEKYGFASRVRRLEF